MFGTFFAGFNKLTIEDFVLEDYAPEPSIKRRMAV